jgi:hypothetical protein
MAARAKALCFGAWLLAAAGLPASAAEKIMAGAEIRATLTGAHVEGDGWSQSFDDGGATTYTKGGTHSQGRWDVRGNEYCSLWPPSDGWVCYSMTIETADPTHEQVTWISADGHRNAAHLIRKGQ